MVCEQCGKIINQQNKFIRVIKNNRPHIVNFDSYECYLKFWDGVPNFIPLLPIENTNETNAIEAI